MATGLATSGSDATSSIARSSSAKWKDERACCGERLAAGLPRERLPGRLPGASIVHEAIEMQSKRRLGPSSFRQLLQHFDGFIHDPFAGARLCVAMKAGP